jgi:anti-sigma factor RsiW
MTSNFDTRDSSGQDTAKEMDSLQRDRFELLSAFIDGEVTAAERKQVQHLLATDPQMQNLHTRLITLRQGLQKLPVPALQTNAQETAKQVFARIDRRRIRKSIAWGGAAIAAVFIGGLSGIFPGSQPLGSNFAQSPQQEAAEPLKIALNKPIIEITKAPVAAPSNLLKTPAVRESIEPSKLN